MLLWPSVTSLVRHLPYGSSSSSLFSHSPSFSTPRQGGDFHFTRVFKGDTVAVAQVRHEHYLFARLKLRALPGEQLHVLEIGCGIGSAALELAEYANVMVVGIDEDALKVCIELLSDFSVRGSAN